MDSPSLEVFKSRPDAVLEEMWSQAGMLGLRAGIRGWTHLACVRWEVSWDNLWSSLALRSVEVQICSQSGGAPHVSLTEQRPGLWENL